MALISIGREATDTRKLTPAGRIIFPAEGISFDRYWGPVFKKNIVKVPMPDGDLVAERFRGWCREKAISLNAKGTEKTFVTFFRKYR